MARPTYSQGMATVKSLTITVAQLGALVAFIAGSLKFRMPEQGKIIGITMNAAAKGGTHVTSTIDVLEGATSLLTAVFDVAAHTAGTPVDKEGSALAAAADVVAKDAELVIT